MNTLLIIISCIVFYIIGFLLVWSHTKLLHSYRGRESTLKPNGGDVVLCLIPFINLLGGVLSYLFFWPIKPKPKEPKPKKDYVKFFRIKKEEPNPIPERPRQPRRNTYMPPRTQCSRENQFIREIGRIRDPDATDNDIIIDHPKQFSLKKNKTL